MTTGHLPTVAAIVIDDPRTARVFERFGIDYCCRGDSDIESACAVAGVPVVDVEAAIAALDDPVDDAASWVTLDMLGLIDHVVETHHAFARSEMQRLAGLLKQTVDAHGSTHPELGVVVTAFGDVVSDLFPHLCREEHLVFPLARAIVTGEEPEVGFEGGLSHPIAFMHAEHDSTAKVLDALRRATDDFTPPADACATWRALYAGLAELEADTHRHIHKENYRLFPAILRAEAEAAVNGG
ncbi:MAG: DUF542 domain-containing protein [Acidimicrobiia bacterium]